MTKPKVSIIIPFFNRIEWLMQAIKSIAIQTYRDYEVILIDDGSTEHIDVKPFQELTSTIRYFRIPHSGPGTARNIGIENSKGEYVAFLDSDDLFKENKLEKQVEFMDRTGSMWSHTSFETFDVNGITHFEDSSWLQGSVFNIILLSGIIATPTVMVRRSALENPLRRFAENMRYGEDTFLWLKLAEHYELVSIAESLSLVRDRGSNSIYKAYSHLKARAQMFEYMRKNRGTYLGKSKLFPIYLLYWITFLEHSLLDRFLIPKGYSQDTVEFISKIFYAPVWGSFKLFKSLEKLNLKT